MVMTYQQAIDIVDLIRSKYRFYGVSITLLDDNVSDIETYMVFGRLGLALIESVIRPADAYYIQNVVFPAFVKRVFPSKRGVKVDCSFGYWLLRLRQSIPQFYFNLTIWPVSTR